MTETKINHHLDPATLMSFAAGSLVPAVAAVAAQHITMCAQCRRDLAVAEKIGKGLITSLSPENLSAPADLKALADRKERARREFDRFRAILGGLEEVRWRRIAPGLQQYRLQAGGAGTLHLLKAAPGAQVPVHDHAGDELTLVLQGALLDGGERFEVGDVADHDEEEVGHQPAADPVAGCICVIGAEGKVRFRSWLARLVQPYHGM